MRTFLRLFELGFFPPLPPGAPSSVRNPFPGQLHPYTCMVALSGFRNKNCVRRFSERGILILGRRRKTKRNVRASSCCTAPRQTTLHWTVLREAVPPLSAGPPSFWTAFPGRPLRSLLLDLLLRAEQFVPTPPMDPLDAGGQPPQATPAGPRIIDTRIGKPLVFFQATRTRGVTGVSSCFHISQWLISSSVAWWKKQNWQRTQTLGYLARR